MTTDHDNPTHECISEWIASSLRGDQSAYQALYEAFAPGLYRLCYGILLNVDDAEDVSQEAFVYAFKNLKRYDPSKSAFKTWLYTIAICRCRNLYRRQRPPLLDIASIWGNPLAAPHSETPEAMYARQDARQQLEHALCRLKPALREAVVLRYGHGLTYREIAEVMECPPKTAESRLRLAHDALRILLEPAGIGLLEELLSY